MFENAYAAWARFLMTNEYTIGAARETRAREFAPMNRFSRIFTNPFYSSDEGPSRKERVRPSEAASLTAWAFTFGLVGISIYSFSSAHVFNTLGILCMVGLGSTLFGAVLGFLFGIPRYKAEITEGGDKNKGPRVAPNSNLIEISDWLTKIIVGATLVQLRPLVEDFNALSLAIGDQLAGPGGAVASGATMIFFFADGFMLGYLVASLLLFQEMHGLFEGEAEPKHAVATS